MTAVTHSAAQAVEAVEAVAQVAQEGFLYLEQMQEMVAVLVHQASIVLHIPEAAAAARNQVL
jgi:hypothetical protein